MSVSASEGQGLSGAVQESGADSGEPHESHELCLTKVVWQQEGVVPVVAPSVQGYHGKLGTTIFSQTQLQSHILESQHKAKQKFPGSIPPYKPGTGKSSSSSGSNPSETLEHASHTHIRVSYSTTVDTQTHRNSSPVPATDSFPRETQGESPRIVPAGAGTNIASHDDNSSSSNRSLPTTEPSPLPHIMHEPLQRFHSEDHSDVGTSSELSYPNREHITIAAECLHAQDYPKMIEMLSHVQRSTHVYTTLCVEFGLSLAYFKLKQYKNASEHLLELERIAKSHRSYTGNAALACYYLGEMDFTQSRYADAVKQYAEAVAHFSSETVADQFRVIPPTLSTIYTRRAGALRNDSKIMDAVRDYRQAISTADSKKDELSAHTSLGNLFQSVGENASALAEYEHSIRLSEELQDHVSLGWAYGNMGNAYLGLYQRDKGLYYLEKALDLTVEHEPTPQAIGRAYNNLGTAYQAMNELDKAQENYDLALSQAIYGNDVAGQARVYGNIGNLLMLQKKYLPAIAHYSETLTITSDKSTRSTAHHNRGCAEYERAESEKRSLVQRSSSDNAAAQGKFEFQFHGPEFRDVEFEHQPVVLPDSILQRYRQASQDLSKVVSYHEETFKTIKGSPKGLTLSVSLFETNSRTFHRLQDCLYNLDEWHQALCYAEQSRARSLGELMLQKKGSQLEHALTSPLTIDQITEVVKAEEVDVVFLSYTGARLLVWVLSPIGDSISINMFHVALEDDQFEGKSLDYYIRYSLQELLIEKNVEMYAFCSYSQPSPVTLLDSLFAQPLMKIFKAVRDPEATKEVRDVILIPDSYTHLMPIVALLNLTNGGGFLGDHYRFRIMPSLLTMGIVKQLPQVVVNVPEDSLKFCIVGNPTIPQFKFKDDIWNLGKLPFATEEAEWVAHILKCNPTLHEQATKMLVLSMISNAKVVHLATHGSSAAGFLAFASVGSSRRGEPPDEKMVLVYPEEIERMTISPALVVLSSCDSGRGTVKADGILGMARAFILAGAQAVLTTLWRVPDESASIFMQFFYQYLMEGHRASVALHKAILSVRCFLKYSAYIHWSGYQLMGREIQFRVVVDPGTRAVQTKVGRCTMFPRLDIVKKLEESFVRDPQPPTDVQLLQGSHGLKPKEPVIDFISRFHTHFTGGVFWVNGTCPELIQGAAECIRATPSTSFSQPVLVVLDNIQSLPDSEYLMALFRSHHTHIIVTLNSSSPPDAIVKEIDCQLLRGTNVIQVKTLSTLHITQRIVHAILSHGHFTPHNKEQQLLAQLAERTCGSPAIVDITSALLQRCLDESGQRGEGEGEEEEGFLEEFVNKIQQPAEEPRTPSQPPSPLPSAEGSAMKQEDLSQFTDTQFTMQLIDACNLPHTDYFLLSILSTFGPIPIPRALVEIAQSLVTAAKFGKHSQARHTPLTNLLAVRLLRVYPSTVIKPPSGVPIPREVAVRETYLESDFYYVPQLVSDALGSRMEQMDQVFSITTAYRSLLQFTREPGTRNRVQLCFAAGLANMIVKLCDRSPAVIDLNCYREIYHLYVTCRANLTAEHPSINI